MPFWQPNCSPSRSCDGLLAFDNQVSLKFVVFFLKKCIFTRITTVVNTYILRTYSCNLRTNVVFSTYAGCTKNCHSSYCFFCKACSINYASSACREKGESGRVSVVKGAVFGEKAVFLCVFGPKILSYRKKVVSLRAIFME